MRPHGTPQGEHRAVREGRRAQPGQQVRGTAAEHRLDRDAAGDGHIAAYPAGRRADVHHRSRGHPHRRPQAAGRPSTVTRQGAPVTATVTAERGRTAQPLRVVSSTAAPGGLPASRLASAARGRVQRPGARHTEVGVAGAAPVLHGGQRSGPDHGERTVRHERPTTPP
ncbi:hypothetical protein GCM10020295_69680 [Streptomyces cinereospinus]